MASLRRHKGSKFWYACITVDGRQRQFSTGLEDRAEALAAAVAAERAIRRHRDTHQLRRALERLADDFAPQCLTPIGEYLADVLAGKTSELSSGAFKNIRASAKFASAYFAANGIAHVEDVTSDHITAIRDELANGRTRSSVSASLARLNTLFRPAVDRGLISKNPVAGVRAGRGEGSVRREFSQAELARLIPTLDPTWRAMVMLGLYTGQRMGDLATLRWSQIDMDSRTLTLTTAKTGRLINLPLLEPAIDALAELPATDDPRAHVFPNLAAMPRNVRSREFGEILQSVGLMTTEKRTDGRRRRSELTFHSLRHTATTMLKAAGVTDSIAREIIGHSSAAVSRAYTHLDLDTIRSAMAKLPRIG